MNITAILVVTILLQGETSSSKQFDFVTMEACETAREKILQEHKRAIEKDPKTPGLIAACSTF